MTEHLKGRISSLLVAVSPVTKRIYMERILFLGMEL